MSRTSGTWNTKGIWAAGVMLAAVVALTVYAAFSGDDGGSHAGKGGARPSASSSTGPAPTYTQPDDWTEPARWASLPRGARTNADGLPVGFPHTTEGAVAQMVAANNTDIEGATTTVDAHLARYDTYMSSEDKSAAKRERVRQGAAEADAELRRELGLPTTGDMPSGAYMRAYVVGFKVVRETDDEVGVYLLSEVTMKAGESAKEKSSYIRNVAAARWEGGDWKASAAAAEELIKDVQGQEKPAMAAPGDAKFNTAGWTALREAS